MQNNLQISMILEQVLQVKMIITVNGIGIYNI